jgi:ABC-type nitrate/sulfonate/bicarbonate transport system substrate-binding protein
VPEHFNFPWHLAIESGTADACLLDWRDYPSGTGAMLADLVAGKLDLAVLLTEGAALGLARGLPVVAVSLYTRSPLIWGVHTLPGSGFGAIGALDGARFAISRKGSGSHLMSLALALEQGCPSRRSASSSSTTSLALSRRSAKIGPTSFWERFTTEPGRGRQLASYR